MGKREARKTQVAPIFPLGRLGWVPATQDPWGSRSAISSPEQSEQDIGALGRRITERSRVRDGVAQAWKDSWVSAAGARGKDYGLPHERYQKSGSTSAWIGAGVCPQRHRPVRGDREGLVHTEVVFLSQDVAVFTCPGQTHPCLEKGSTCQPKDVPCLGEFYEYYLLMNKSIKSVFLKHVKLPFWRCQW